MAECRPLPLREGVQRRKTRGYTRLRAAVVDSCGEIQGRSRHATMARTEADMHAGVRRARESIGRVRLA